MNGTTIRNGFDMKADAIHEDSMGKSDIQEFYKGTTIFLDGATGFLGKLTLEKLLRTCTDIKKIYILLRPKKGKDINERFEQLFEGPVSTCCKKIKVTDENNQRTFRFYFAALL